MIRILLGGSPCTYWSIAKADKRETEATGVGWELFKNYLIAKEKFAPDIFLYENNKSAAPAIKQQIRTELSVFDGTFLMTDSGARYIEINSALVSAQHRERELILDPFMGSFATAVAAYKLQRDFIGFEIDDDYYAAGSQWLNNTMSQVSIFDLLQQNN